MPGILIPRRGTYGREPPGSGSSCLALCFVAVRGRWPGVMNRGGESKPAKKESGALHPALYVLFLATGDFYCDPAMPRRAIDARVWMSAFEVPPHPADYRGRGGSVFRTGFQVPVELHRTPFPELMCPGALPVSAPLPPVLTGCEPAPVRCSPGRSAFCFTRLTYDYSGRTGYCQQIFGGANGVAGKFFAFRLKENPYLPENQGSRIRHKLCFSFRKKKGPEAGL